jgi:hypothetical protein
VTLRLVSDHDKPGELLYCRMGGMCDIYRHRATILVSIAGNPYRPSCDECARRAYENIGDSARMAPLAEYVDMFAAAKEAALATQEQITAPVQVTASAVVDAEVIRHVWQEPGDLLPHALVRGRRAAHANGPAPQRHRRALVPPAQNASASSTSAKLRSTR